MNKDNQSPELFGQTPWQTVGPFFHYALPWKGCADLITQTERGARPDLVPAEHDLLTYAPAKGAVSGCIIEIFGHIFDGEGKPIPDALIEIWQANAAGRYNSRADTREELQLDPDFIGFGRCATAEDGRYALKTIIPGRVPGPGNALQAPHLAVSIQARGMIKRLVTRIYFAGSEGLHEDPILALVPDARRRTLIATRTDAASYRLDIRIQGPDETVFFEL